MDNTSVSLKDSINALKKISVELSSFNEQIETTNRKIENTNDDIYQCKNEISSLKSKLSDPIDNREISLRKIKNDYNDDISNSERNYRKIIGEIEAKNNRNIELELNQIKREENDFNTSNQKKIDDSITLIQQWAAHKAALEMNLQALNERLENTNNENEQILQFRKTIEEDYSGISNNTRLNADIACPNYGVEQVVEKCNRMNDSVLLKFANKLKNNSYISKPRKSSGLPIGDIFLNIFSVIGMIFAGIGKFFAYIYKPVSYFRSSKAKTIYALSISTVILLCFFLLVFYCGEALLISLFVIAGALVLLFVVLLIVNLVKYGNRTMNTELNFCYYSVGYSYMWRRDELMNRISSILLNKMKVESPEKYNSFVQGIQANLLAELENLKQAIQQADNNLTAAQSQYSVLEQNVAVARSSEMSRFESRRNAVYEHYSKELEEIKTREAEKHKKELEKIELNYNNSIADIDNIMKKEQEANKKAIESQEQYYNDLVAKLNTLKAELSDIENKVEHGAKTLRGHYDCFTEGNVNIEAIQKREPGVNDTLNPDLFVGIEINDDGLRISGNRTFPVYSPMLIRSNGNPVIIKHSGFDGEDDRKLSETIYTIADNIFANLIETRYYRSFCINLIDSNLPTEGTAFDQMRITSCNNEAVRKRMYLPNDMLVPNINKGPAEKIFTDLLSNRANNVLNNRDIESVNQSDEYKNKEKMVNYVFAIMRLYKGGDFNLEMLNTKLQDCRRNGILPIIFISEANFTDRNNEEAVNKAIRQNCEGYYYTLTAEDSKKPVISKVSV